MSGEIEREFKFETLKVDERGQVVERATARAYGFAVDLGSGATLDMVALPGGAFVMGTPPGAGFPDETPQHSVTVAAFYMARHPVTQEQWLSVLGKAAPCRGRGARRPVENINWFQAAEFCRRLSARLGRQYRLPGEGQWEYACRAGTSSAFSCGETLTTELANYVGEQTYRGEPPGIYRHGTTEVGSFPPNAFGLYDMHGNVWEWCADTWHADYRGAPAGDGPWTDGGEPAYRVARGGSWHDGPNLCRSATRLRLAAAEGDDFIGFRVAAA